MSGEDTALSKRKPRVHVDVGDQVRFIQDVGPIPGGTYGCCISIQGDYLFFWLSIELFGVRELKIKKTLINIDNVKRIR